MMIKIIKVVEVFTRINSRDEDLRLREDMHRRDCKTVLHTNNQKREIQHSYLFCLGIQ